MRPIYQSEADFANPDLQILMDIRSKMDRDEDRDQYIQIMNNILNTIITKSHFIAVLKFTDAKGEYTTNVNQADNIAFSFFKGEDGKPYLPLYTDWENLKKSTDYELDKISTASVNFEDICKFTKNCKYGAIINPFKENIMLSPVQLKKMKKVKEARARVEEA